MIVLVAKMHESHLVGQSGSCVFVPSASIQPALVRLTLHQYEALSRCSIFEHVVSSPNLKTRSVCVPAVQERSSDFQVIATIDNDIVRPATKY